MQFDSGFDCDAEGSAAGDVEGEVSPDVEPAGSDGRGCGDGGEACFGRKFGKSCGAEARRDRGVARDEPESGLLASSASCFWHEGRGAGSANGLFDELCQRPC